MRAWLAAHMLLLLFGPPFAGASGSLETTAATVRIEGAHGTDCSHPLAGFCLFNVTGADEGVGATTIDARQRIHYVGVATNLSAMRRHLGEIWLLPDQSVTLDFSQVYLKHPAFRTTVEAWQAATEGR